MFTKKTFILLTIIFLAANNAIANPDKDESIIQDTEIRELQAKILLNKNKKSAVKYEICRLSGKVSVGNHGNFYQQIKIDKLIKRKLFSWNLHDNCLSRNYYEKNSEVSKALIKDYKNTKDSKVSHKVISNILSYKDSFREEFTDYILNPNVAKRVVNGFKLVGTEGYVHVVKALGNREMILSVKSVELALLKALEKENEDIILEASRALSKGYTTHNEAVKILRGHLTSKKENVRKAALDSLANNFSRIDTPTEEDFWSWQPLFDLSRDNNAYIRGTTVDVISVMMGGRFCQSDEDLLHYAKERYANWLPKAYNKLKSTIKFVARNDLSEYNRERAAKLLDCPTEPEKEECNKGFLGITSCIK